MKTGDLVIPKLTPWRRAPATFPVYEVLVGGPGGSFVLRSPSKGVPVLGACPGDYELFLAVEHRGQAS